MTKVNCLVTNHDSHDFNKLLKYVVIYSFAYQSTDNGLKMGMDKELSDLLDFSAVNIIYYMYVYVC